MIIAQTTSHVWQHQMVNEGYVLKVMGDVTIAIPYGFKARYFETFRDEDGDWYPRQVHIS